MLRRLTGMVAAAVVTAVATVGVGVGVGAATATATAERAASPPLPPLDRPLSDARTHRPLACPDPSVTRAPRGRFTYLLFCTSDQAPDAFGIYGSSDLRDWTRLGSVFPRGHQPAWALPAGVHHSPGRFWGPSINFIGGRWVLYFSAEYDPASHAAPKRLSAGTMVLGAATARSPQGPWHATLLHYPGELPTARGPGAVSERHGGGDIDPAAVLDPVTGQRLLVWSQQHDRIWLSGLSRDGLTLGPTAQLAFSHTPANPWECDPPTRSATATRGCTVEGPDPLFHDGRMFVLYSGADTWNATYAVGVASAPAPFSPFTKDPEPILRSGHGILGPGGVSNPIAAPGGGTVVLYHALTRPDPRHRSDQRQLMVGTLGWTRGGQPIIDNGTP